MVEDTNQYEESQHSKPMSLLGMTVITGFFGGIFWSAIAKLAYLFHFTEIQPNVILEGWVLGEWKDGWIGSLISIFLLGILSIAVALIYYFTLRQFKSIYVGILYGLVLFFLVFLVLNGMFSGIAPLTKLDRNTITTCICLYILFGAFIGYSISFEVTEIKKFKDVMEKDMKTS